MNPSLRGVMGEKIVNLHLFLGLDHREYTVYSDVTFEVLDGTTQIDFVVLSRFGIFVIEVKNLSGLIYGSTRSKTWTQVLNKDHKYKFQNPIHQNYRHIKCLESLLGLPESVFINLVNFQGHCKSRSDLPETITFGNPCIYIQNLRSLPILDEQELRRAKAILEYTVLPKGEKTNSLHLKSLMLRHQSLFEA